MGIPVPNFPLLTYTWGSLKKAVMGSFAAVLFGATILILSLFAVTRPQAAADTQAMPTPVATASAQKIEYYLPYPGILPDSPLYKIKALRDKIKLALVFDPMQKSQRELLLADKRINAAQALLDGGKSALAVTTATKAEKYLEQSVNRVLDLARSGRDVKSQLMTLEKATAKHLEILTDMDHKVTAEEEQALKKSLNTTQVLWQSVQQAQLEN